ncbi:MAG: SRPBCC family protein [Verrucomicrobiales bacterium]
METTRSIEIDRPIEVVFDYTLSNVSEWSIFVVEDEMTSAGPVKVGTTFHTVTEERGERVDFDGRVTKHEPPTAHSIVMQGKQFSMEVDYTFTELDNRTKVTQHSKVHAMGFLRVMFALFGWAMKKSSCDALDKELASLKKYCADKTTTSVSP